MLLAHGVKQGRPRLHLHADDPRDRLRDARVRAHRRGALGRVRRLLAPSRCATASSTRVQGGGHRERGPARRQADPAQGDRRQGDRGAVDCVETVLVARRTDADVPMQRRPRPVARRGDAAKQRSTCPVEWMGAEDPLFILYTSGSTGKPKGAAAHDRRLSRLRRDDAQAACSTTTPGDVYCCAADVGWITGHSYIVYGPLANGATTVMFESTPALPRRRPLLADGRRPRRQHLLHRADRAARDRAGRRRVGEALLAQERCASSASVGEPINPEIWRWYHDVVGEGRCAVVDTWWQTETGGILITPLPGATPTKPGSATLPFFGVKPVIVDPEDGTGARGQRRDRRPVPGDAVAGPGAHHLGRPPALQRDLLLAVPRATTSPATAAAATRTATTGSPAASTTCSTSRATGSAPPRSRARWSRTRRWPRRRWSASRTRSRARASTPT